MPRLGDVALNRLVGALRDPLTLDPERAEWVAEQLLQVQVLTCATWQLPCRLMCCGSSMHQ